MNTLQTISCAAALFGLVGAFGANAQDMTCGKNHYILDFAVSPWTPTGNLNVPRGYHTATLLHDGRVLVSGGSDRSDTAVVALDSAELYDPATGVWTLTGSLTQPRVGHKAILLPSGKVLVVGGEPGPTGAAELYDPDTGAWSATGRLNLPRTDFTATLLANGKVLVVGGDGIPTAELYDASTETWSFTGDLYTSRVSHTAALLQDGRVMVVGGAGDQMFDIPTPIVEVYDPIAGVWSRVHDLAHPREFHTATTLQDGKVLVVGGGAADEAFDPITGTWQDVGNQNFDRSNHTATFLLDGEVLIAGGTGNVSSTESYDPWTSTWKAIGNLGSARWGHTATLLSDGSVLVAGGLFSVGRPMTCVWPSPCGNGNISLGTAELYAAPSDDHCE